MPINKPGIEELKKKSDSSYTLVIQASRRARQLMDGAQTLLEDDEQSHFLRQSRSSTVG